MDKGEGVKEVKVFNILKINMSNDLNGIICLDGEDITDKIISLVYEYKVINGIKTQNVLIDLYGGLSYKINAEESNRIEIDSSINSKNITKKNKK